MNMIYTRWGDEVEIVAYHGKHQPKWAGGKLVLVSVRHKSEPEQVQHWFAHNLKASDGLNEINAAVDAVPEVALSKADLAKAIKQAE